MIPTRQWIYTLMADRRMPPHIVRHSHMVRAAAVLISYRLRSAGIGVDMKLVDRAALLHDICKIDSLERGGDHALMARLLMEEHGFHRIGDIVGQHIRLRSMEVDEAMIIHYADKRVMHDTLVSLDRRFLDLMDRYAGDEQGIRRIMQHYMHACEIEKTLFRESGIDPGWLENLNLIPGDHPLYGGDGVL